MGCEWIPPPPPPGLTDFKKPRLNRVNKIVHTYVENKRQFQLHKIEIEQGRRLDIQRDKRYCLIREQTEVGDELHYLLDCQALEMERKAAFSKITEFDQPFISLNIN